MVALVIIYNHRYDKNIPILEKIYGDRFSHILHLVPFYDGDKENVISVYDNSYYFQGYIAQASKTLRDKGNFDHYLFIGDDLLLNPELNETNYESHFNIDKKTSFLPGFIELSKREDKWRRLYDALNYRLPVAGLEANNELPSIQEALNKFKEKNLEEPFLKPKNLYSMPNRQQYPKGPRGYYHYLKRKKEIKTLLETERIDLAYPLVGGYSDILVVSGIDFEKFAHYCGVFSASNLFVELAIPTAMVIACEKIQTEKDTAKQGATFWSAEENQNFEAKYNTSLTELLSAFPKDVLYFHPVKLSKWKSS